MVTPDLEAITQAVIKQDPQAVGGEKLHLVKPEPKVTKLLKKKKKSLQIFYRESTLVLVKEINSGHSKLGSSGDPCRFLG